MTTYVLYCLNEAGRISRSEPVEADSDDAALEQARAMKRGTDCELWLHDRRVGRIPAAPKA